MKAILFDLDNTLYAADQDLFSLIDVRINRYMEEIVAIAADQVDDLRRLYWRDYGATLQGLIRHHNVNPEDYLDYVHAVDVGSRLGPDEELRRVLETMPVPSYVFTNACRAHAERVLEALGLDGLFADVFDIRVDDYQPKPNPGPYRQVLSRLNLTGEQCVMVEDQPQNLKTAKHFGMRTILVGGQESTGHSYIDVWLPCSARIGGIIEQWRGKQP